jgi:predicted nucleotidyltransferase
LITPIEYPKALEQDIQHAIRILREEGCSEVFLFGSAATGRLRAESDIDLAARGIPRGRFFSLIGRLLFELEHSVDLVDLDKQRDFAKHLEKENALVQIA